MSELDLANVRAPVVLRCSVRVAGREIAAIQEVPRLAWDDADDLIRATLESALRARLGESVMTATRSLPDYAAIGEAPVHAHIPTELQDQMYREMLRSIETPV